MRRNAFFILGILAAFAAPLAPVSAQEAETEAETSPTTQSQRPPVFSLPPGEVREQAQPNVQGPRAPGVSSPRLIDPDADPTPSSSVNTSRPAMTSRQPDPAPAVTVSRPQSAPDHAAQSRVSVSRPPSSAPETDSSSIADLPRPLIADQSPVPEPAETDASPVADAPLDQRGIAWWVWLLGLGAIVGLAVVIRIVSSPKLVKEEEAPELAPLIRKKAQPDAEPEAHRAPTPAPETPTPAMAAAPVASPAADAPSRIEVDFQPLSARLSTLGLTLTYRLTLFNISDGPLQDIAVRLGMRCADSSAMESAAEAGPPCVSFDTLEAGASHTHTGEIRLDPTVFKPLQSDGKPMLVPIVDMVPCYRDSDDVLHEMHAAMLVGRELEPPTPKMQPFWLERGFGQFGAIGCRMLSVKTA
ncbi:hypothetical protein [Parasphingopyxis lamellibrachiae]|uniref:hypothetical protein n=1 Tax=Parasphingopyxis lamellibrachiae TaxID=680125 RepID=UPI000E2311A5|nr:hypothetical protein [Parasphingopyxis lamellibrachiae]